MTYSLANFWLPRLEKLKPQTTSILTQGWSIEPQGSRSFIEADLILRPDLGDVNTPIWFVAAPGAVGKSTLAKEISAKSGAIYLDLARADTVAGNYLTGGLVKNKLYSSWENQTTTVLIDALDEARLRVTQNSFEDFLRDVAEQSHTRSLPTVLFGRVGIVEEAWYILSEQGTNCPVFDIDFFDQQQALDFVMATLDRFSENTRHPGLSTRLAVHRDAYRGAANNLVIGISEAAASDGNRFSGYAPVLEAVATVLADETNPARVNATNPTERQNKILRELTDQVLEREATKLREQLPPTIPQGVKERLYNPGEQLSHLASVIFDTGKPAPPCMVTASVCQ